MIYLETPHLTIRSFVPEDANDLYEILGDAETMEYSEPPYDLDKTERFLDSFCISRGGAVAAVHKECGKVIGYLLFNEVQSGEYELGWFFNRQFWRRGYAVEACKAVIHHAFHALGAQKIFAGTIDGVKSVGLMHKLGMQLEKTQYDHETKWYVYELKGATGDEKDDMNIACVWEHNGNATLLYAANFPGAYTRGSNLEIAVEKMPAEIRSYLKWKGQSTPANLGVTVVQDADSSLDICDADSDVLFLLEREPLSQKEYVVLKNLVLKSAADFLALYQAIPDKTASAAPVRTTFYGQVPRTAEEMYQHTKNVNAYYFGEIGVDADNEGTILECRSRGFEQLEQAPNFLDRAVLEGSYGENWSLRKVLRRFLWHDRIHAKAMYRMAVKAFGVDEIPNVFCFQKS